MAGEIALTFATAQVAREAAERVGGSLDGKRVHVDLKSFREFHGLTLEAFGRMVEPPIGRHDMSKVETGSREAGPVLSVRLRNAMAKVRARPAEDER